MLSQVASIFAPTDQARVGKPLPLAALPPGHQCGHFGQEEAADGQQDHVPALCLAPPQQVQAGDGPPDQAAGQGSPDKPLFLPHG